MGACSSEEQDVTMLQAATCHEDMHQQGMGFLQHGDKLAKLVGICVYLLAQCVCSMLMLKSEALHI